MCIKENLEKVVRRRLSNKQSFMDVSCELYLYKFPEAFKNNEDVGFDILKEVSCFFGTPFSTIFVAGSAQLGYSSVNGKPFVAGDSDLDIAIISATLYQHFFELAHHTTKSFTNLTKFRITSDGENTSEIFQSYLLKGIIRPDFLPDCKEKNDWLNFFGKLGNEHVELFKTISAAIYFSEHFFKVKQLYTVNKLSKA